MATKLTVSDCSLGVNKDLMPQELPPGMWSDCQNMRFARGFAERIGGIYNQLSTPTVTPYHLAFFQTATKNWWIWSGIAKSFAHDGTAAEEITASDWTGAIDNRFTGGTLVGLFYLNNGVDAPRMWTGVSGVDLASVTGWDANWRCKAFRPFERHNFAIGMTESGTVYKHKLRWSCAAEGGSQPATWDFSDATKDAGFKNLAEVTDPLVDGMGLGSQFIIYGERSMFKAFYVGKPDVFSFQRIETSYGMMAPGCGALTPLGHVFLAVGDVCLFDGNSAPISIADAQVRKWIFDTMDVDNYERSFVTTNPVRSEVLICFPSKGKSSCDKCAVWNWVEKKWGLRDMPNVTYGASGLVSDPTAVELWSQDTNTLWNTDSSPWTEETLALNQTRLMLCRVAPAISAFDFGGQDGGVDLSSYLERKSIPVDEGVTLFKDVYPSIDAPYGTVIYVYLGASMAPGLDPTYQAARRFVVGTDFKVTVMAKGRYASVKFAHSGREQWRIRSYSIGIQQAGKF